MKPPRCRAFALDPLVFVQAAALLRDPPSPPVDVLIKNERETVIWPQDVGAGRRAVLKMYRHRGPVTFLRERITRYVVQREFEALDHLRKWGVPCSEPIAWSHGTSGDHGRFEILATWEVADAHSLRTLAGAPKPDGLPWDLASLYRSVRRMHESGMFHGALHLRNVLAARGRTGEFAFHIIDTPRALLYPGSIVGTSMARFDLLLLSSQAVRHLGLPGSRIPLEEYGLDAAGRQALLKRLPGFQPTKFDRQLIRAESSVRLGCARLGKERVRPAYREIST